MTTTRRLALGALAGVLLCNVSACSNSDPGGTGVNTPGPITVSLTTPSRDDGALIVVVTGSAFTGATAASAAYTLYWRPVSGTETRVAVVGNIVAGPLFTVTAPSGTAASEFTATVSEVANRADALRASTAGYSLSVAR